MVGFGMAALTIAACGSSSSSSGGGDSNSTSSAVDTPFPGANDAANQGGTMNVGVVQEPTSFLAAGITDSMTFSYAVDAPITEGLIWYRSTDETQSAKTLSDFWQPWLATEVPTVDNGDVKTSGCKNTAAKMCVTWKLRTDVTWHDGSKFSSKDVCATVDFFWLKYKDKNPTAILSTSGWDQMMACDATNPAQAVIDFKTQYGAYLGLLSGVYGIMPAKQLQTAFTANGGQGADLEKTAQTVDLTIGSGNTDAFKGTDTLDKIAVGTGPYVLQKYEPTKDIILVPNKNYWNKAKFPPHLAQIIFKFIPDVQSQLDQAKAGQIDFGMDYRLKFLKDLQSVASNGKLKVETIPDSGAEKIDFNTCDNAKGLCGPDAKKSPVVADKAVRKAILEGINRQSIVDTIAAGATKVPRDSWGYLGDEYTLDTSSNPQTAYNVQKANSDLDAAGYKVDSTGKCKAGDQPGRLTKDGASCITLQFVTTSGNPARASAQVAIQSDLNKLGIATQLSTIKAGKLFGGFTDGGVLYTHQFDMAMYTNTLSAPAEPDSDFASYHADCGGTCPELNQIPSAANKGQGQNDTGENNPDVDAALTAGRNSVDLATRTKSYKKVWSLLAADLPEAPLYQQVTVNSYSANLKGLERNDVVWTFDIYKWYCDKGNCQA